jgi:hypothetical protein
MQLMKLKVIQYQKNGEVAATYNFVGMFPIDLSPNRIVLRNK